MAKVHRRTLDDRPVVILNTEGQPVRPKAVVVEIGRFLGTLAKDPELVPFNILDWKFMPTKEKFWSYVRV